MRRQRLGCAGQRSHGLLGDEDHGSDDRAVSLRGFLVVKQDGGGIDDDYPLATIAIPQEGTNLVFVAAVLVGIGVGGEIVAAFPASVWNWSATRRVLPRNSIKKVTAGRVKLASMADRATEPDAAREAYSFVTAESAPPTPAKPRSGTNRNRT